MKLDKKEILIMIFLCVIIIGEWIIRVFKEENKGIKFWKVYYRWYRCRKCERKGEEFGFINKI